MKILALDTSTDACSVALSVDALVCERFERGQKHSSRILSMVDEVLAESGLSLTQLDALAFGRGPGSFTGLRIGTGVVQGLGFGADLPVVPVSSLATLAQGQDARCVLAAFDGRMSQVYWGAYLSNADGLVELRGREQVLAPCDVPLPGPNTTGSVPAAVGTLMPRRFGYDWVGVYEIGSRTAFRMRAMWRGSRASSSIAAQRSRRSRHCRCTFATKSREKYNRSPTPLTTNNKAPDTYPAAPPPTAPCCRSARCAPARRGVRDAAITGRPQP